ncbi:hypothetical protein JCM5350_007416 [Sporobolomyces pararoseus]
MSAESAPITEAIQATPEQVGHKCFVGNLSFSTKGTDLSEIFSKVGTVSDAQVIYRGSRSLGYGFVTFPSEDDASKAVSQLDKSEISGRQINVELAKPMPANGGAAARAPKRAAKKAAETAVTQETAKEGVEGEEKQQEATAGEGQQKKRKARKARKPRGPRAPRTDAETEEAGDAPEQSSSNAVSDAADQLANVKLEDGATNSTPRTRKPRARKPKRKAAAANASAAGGESSSAQQQGQSTDAETTTSAAATTSAPRERKPRAPRRRGPPSGEPSKTLIFVGNLPFSVTNESLAATFEGCKVKSATVVTRKFGQAAGRSKGFAFVDFESEEDQQKALNEYQGKELEGRAISLKVAIEADQQQQQQQEQAGSEGQVQEGDNKDEKDGDNEPEATIVAS